MTTTIQFMDRHWNPKIKCHIPAGWHILRDHHILGTTRTREGAEKLAKKWRLDMEQKETKT